jgi:peptidoglycan/xylan/chitin deacetylase (PgdA/CDA1 family)
MKNYTKPIASLSLDLDNQWSYMKTHGDQGWEAFPSFLDIVVPRILNFLHQRDLKITFFIVGQDAALEKNHAAIRMIAEAGHEIGNHSFHHEPWLHFYTEEQIDTDIRMAEEQILRLAGRRPVGFRGPGYSLSQMALKVLLERGYLYDASTLPTFLGPLARLYYFMSAKQLTAEEKRHRDQLFGNFRDGLRPLRPYRWRIMNSDGSYHGPIEIPVTTMPIFKIPIHASYVLYLSTFSKRLAKLYFQTAITLCKMTGTQPSILLHPLDFLGRDDIDVLSFFPAMNLPVRSKINLVGDLINMLTKQYTIVTLEKHASFSTQAKRFPLVAPRFNLDEP